MFVDVSALLCALSIRFLDLFQDNKSLGKDALKFAKNFQISVDHSDTTSVGTKEDWFPMGHILKEFGQSVQDFKTMDDALAAVRHLCAQNRSEHGYEEKPEFLDEKFPQFSRFWFVFSLGKVQQHTSHVQKNLQQDVDLKNLDQLEKAKVFMEGLGFSEGSGSSSVQVENEKVAELTKAVELLKLS